MDIRPEISSFETHEFDYDGQLLKVTASLGVSYWDAGGKITCPDQLVEEVDKYLYQAKNSGRNRVCYETAD
jgi:PleD family two-component response regulator